MSDKEKDKPIVYLNDGRFVEWKRPPRIQREDRILIEPFFRPDASTELLSYAGFETVNERVAQYRVHASAAKYLANIALLGKKRLLYETSEKPSNPVEKMILFAGSISFYKFGEIPGTKIKAYDFVRHGEIFVAKKPEIILINPGGLRQVIFEGTWKEDDKKRIARIEAIIRGYEEQILADSDDERRAVSEEYKRGAADEHEAEHGTFGR